MSSITYVVSILKDAGFKSSQLKPATPTHINKVFSDYLNSCEWSEEWFFSIDPSQLDGEQLKLYDSAKELYDTPDGEVLSDTEDMMITLQLQLGVAECEADAVIIKFSEFYALSIYYHVLKNTTADVWANGNEHEEYASEYSKALLSHYGYDDDEYLTDTTLEKNFSDVVKQLVHDPYDLWVIAHMTSKVVKEYHAHCQEYLWTSHKSDILNGWAKYVPVPSGSSQYVIACDVEVVEPVRDDVKLPEPVEVIVIPQEVVSEPQEDLSTTTQINGDDVMNNNTVWLDWSISTPCLKAWELDFGTYVPVVEVEYKPHYSDKWFGQCCDLNDNPEFTQWDIVRTGKPYFSEVIEFTPLPSKAPSIMNIGRGKVYFPTVLTPEQLDDAKAKIQATVIKAERKASLASPVKQRQVSPHATVPFGNAPEANRITNPKITSAIGEAEAIEFKSTLFNVDDFDVVKQAAQALLEMFSCEEYNTLRTKYGADVMKKAYNSLDAKIKPSILAMINQANNIRNGIDLTVVATQAPKSTPATPKATVTPKTPVSTAKFGTNFNSLVMAKYRELNGGIIKDSLVLNKLTSALRANNSEAYTALVTTFGNPTAVALHKQAYDAVVSAS